MKKQGLIALCFIFLTSCSSSETTYLAKDPRPPTWTDKIGRFSSCNEIAEYVSAYSYMDSSLSATSQHFEPQVEGIQEGDIFQASPKYYFFARSNSIEITTKADLKFQKSLPVANTPLHSILYADKKLISIASDNEKTIVRIYDEEDGFSLLLQNSLEGRFLDFRYVDRNIMLVTAKDYVDDFNAEDCTQIYKPNLENGLKSLTYVYKIGTQSKQSPEKLVLMGSANFFYMSKKELFLFYPTFYQQHTGFQVIDWSSGSLSFNQAQTIEGFLKDRTAVHQQNSDLILATTYIEHSPEESFIDNSPTNNRLISFRKNSKGLYDYLNSSPNFGKTEDIRAVHFINNMAYVVTFQKTDPLYVLDIQDPANITIVSELKSPGFSTQIFPVGKNQFLGIGFDAIPNGNFSWFAGLKISLFDMQSLASPLETSSLIYGERGSYSEAAFTYKALFKSGNTLLLPVVTVEKDRLNNSPWDFGNKHVFSGLIQLEMKNHKLMERQRLSHHQWREKFCGTDSFNSLTWWNIPQNSLDIQRALDTEGCIDSFSRFGITRHCDLSGTPAAKIEYENTKELCN